MTPEEVAAWLRGAGLDIAVGEICVEARENRWLARLPGERMAWFPMNPTGAARLGRERAVLRVIAARCEFRVPRLLHEDVAGWDLRAAVTGVYDPPTLYRRVLAEPGLAARLGADIGRAIAEQHLKIGLADFPAIPDRPSWPPPDDWLWARLPRVVRGDDLMARLKACLDRYAGAQDGTRVLTHGDLGLHNLVLDPTTEGLAGIFDYDGAALGDRHHDFKYLVLDQGAQGLLEAAISAYEPLTGADIDRRRVWLYNTACGIGFLAFRDGHAADEAWCGRTLAEDLAWVENGLARLGL